MSLKNQRAARANGTARHNQSPCKGTKVSPLATIALSEEIRRRRAASQRLEPLADGRADPFDARVAEPVRQLVYGTYDVVTLGLVCSHGPGCLGHVGQDAAERQGAAQRRAA
jgi:hypothetical protein